MNNDYEKRAYIDTNATSWENEDCISRKLLSIKDKEETSLIKLDENSSLNTMTKINSVEIYVLEGTYINEYGKYKEGTYLKLYQEDEAKVKSKEGFTIFRKTNHFTSDENIIINTNTTQWHQGHGNLQVMSLDMQSALVKWPKKEKFLPHKHWGGEEIFVLKGVFMDEYGKYPKGSWIRSPHLSEHFPFVDEETIIYVKTGHL